MKNRFFLMLAAAIFTALLPGCAFHSTLTQNENQHNTSVVLSQKNFKVVSYVTGSASATYIFGIGGTGKNSLIESARSEMLKNSKLIGSSQAVINETVSIKGSAFPFVRKIKVTVGAHIIEFQ